MTRQSTLEHATLSRSRTVTCAYASASISRFLFSMRALDGDYGGNPQCQGQAFLLLTFCKQNRSLQQLLSHMTTVMMMMIMMIMAIFLVHK